MIRHTWIAAALAACGDNTAPPDAPVCPAVACGTTCCTPAADCAATSCACPRNFVPDHPTFVTGVVVKNLPQIPGLVAAIGQFDDAGRRFAQLVAYDPATVRTNVDIDLATSTDFKIGFGYDIDGNQKIRSSFRAMTGHVRLTAACAEGIAGTLTGAELAEIDVFESLDPIAAGCTLAMPTVTFAIAKDCAP